MLIVNLSVELHIRHTETCAQRTETSSQCTETCAQCIETCAQRVETCAHSGNPEMCFSPKLFFQIAWVQ
jgi:hypothetical protein